MLSSCESEIPPAPIVGNGMVHLCRMRILFVFQLYIYQKKAFSCKYIVIRDAVTLVRTIFPATTHRAGAGELPFYFRRGGRRPG